MLIGFFHKAIIQSGVANNPWATIANPKMYGFQLASHFGCDKKGPKEIVEFLRTINPMELVKVQEKILTKEDRLKKIFCVFGPGNDVISDDPFLPLSIDEAMEKGIDVPLFIGTTDKEGIVMLDGNSY